MRISTKPLAELATQVLKRKTFVELGHSLPFNVRGLAYIDPSGAAVVELHPTIFEAKDVRELGETFWHELAHVHLKHVTDKAGASRGKPTAAEVQGAADYTKTAAGRTVEAEADAFAAALRTEFPDAMLWRLCVVE